MTLHTQPSRLKALLVEDDAIIQTVHTHMLQKQGFQVDLVANGQDAINRSATGHYDVMLLDLGLPDVSGQVVLTTLRAREATLQQKRLPIIIATAHGDDLLAECLAQGADFALLKPLSMPQLRECLGKLGVP